MNKHGQSNYQGQLVELGGEGRDPDILPKGPKQPIKGTQTSHQWDLDIL